MITTGAQEGVVGARTERKGTGAAPRGTGTGPPLVVVTEAGTRTTALGETSLLPIVEEKAPSTLPHRGRGPTIRGHGTRRPRPKLLPKMLKYVPPPLPSPGRPSRNPLTNLSRKTGR